MLSVVKIYTAPWFDKRISMKCWWKVTAGEKLKFSNKSLSKCHLVYCNTCNDWSVL